jgi:CheY-like chemotaxis protein
MTEIERGKPRPENDCYRILVLDDDLNQMEKIKAACLLVGQEVIAVSTISEGMHFLTTKDHVDVVVAEAFLENESVFEFLKTLKSMPDHQDVPVMVLAVDPGQIGQFCSELMKETSKVFGAHKFLVMAEFDLEHLMREIAALLPEDKTPKKEDSNASSP